MSARSSRCAWLSPSLREPVRGLWVRWCCWRGRSSMAGVVWDVFGGCGSRACGVGCLREGSGGVGGGGGCVRLFRAARRSCTRCHRARSALWCCRRRWPVPWVPRRFAMSIQLVAGWWQWGPGWPVPLRAEGVRWRSSPSRWMRPRWVSVVRCRYAVAREMEADPWSSASVCPSCSASAARMASPLELSPWWAKASRGINRVAVCESRSASLSLAQCLLWWVCLMVGPLMAPPSLRPLGGGLVVRQAQGAGAGGGQEHPAGALGGGAVVELA